MYCGRGVQAVQIPSMILTHTIEGASHKLKAAFRKGAVWLRQLMKHSGTPERFSELVMPPPPP